MRSAARAKWRCLALVVATALVASASVSASAMAMDLTDLPRPNLELIDADVATQLEARRSAVEELFAAAETGARERAEAVGSLGGLYYLYDYVDLSRWCFSMASSLDPEAPRWPYLAGLAARIDGDPAAAVTAFGRALELSPEDPAVHVRLGDARLALGRTTDAEASYREALRLHAERPAAHYGLGRIAAGRGEHREAIARFERALELQPSATSLHHQIGMAHRALGDREAARRSLAANTGGRLRVVDPVVEALRREIRATSRWFSAGAQSMRTGEYERAIELFAKAREERPDDHLVDYNLALAYLRTGRRPQAMAALEDALEKNPDFRNGHYNLALLLVEDGRLEAAERSLRRAHEIDPEDQPTHLEWAGVLAGLGRDAEAEAELTTLLRRAPQLAGARLRLAQLQLGRGATAAAGDNFRRVLAGDAEPDEVAGAHLGLGSLAHQRRDAAGAVEHYRAAVAVSEAIEPRLALAAALGRMGRFGEAAATFAAAIATAGGAVPVEAHFGRAMALLLDDAESAARSALEEALVAHPDHLPLRHLYARVLATSGTTGVRDGARALEIAREVLRTQRTLAHAETVAMALAEMGDYVTAIDWQRIVVAELERSGPPAALEQARRRLAAYERGEPCRAPWKTG